MLSSFMLCIGEVNTCPISAKRSDIVTVPAFVDMSFHQKNERNIQARNEIANSVPRSLFTKASTIPADPRLHEKKQGREETSRDFHVILRPAMFRQTGRGASKLTSVNRHVHHKGRLGLHAPLHSVHPIEFLCYDSYNPRIS